MANGVTTVGFGVPVAVSSATGAPPSGSSTDGPVHPVQPATPAAAVGQGGNAAPPAGEPLPAHAPAVQSQLIQLQAAVEGINRFLRDSQRQLLFQIDLKSGKETLTIVNPATGEVIRQIPSAQVLAAAANLQQAGMPLTGLFIDERA
jgi:flagellar protein FlaG